MTHERRIPPNAIVLLCGFVEAVQVVQATLFLQAAPPAGFHGEEAERGPPPHGLLCGVRPGRPGPEAAAAAGATTTEGAAAASGAAAAAANQQEHKLSNLSNNKDEDQEIDNDDY